VTEKVTPPSPGIRHGSAPGISTPARQYKGTCKQHATLLATKSQFYNLQSLRTQLRSCELQKMAAPRAIIDLSAIEQTLLPASLADVRDGVAEIFATDHELIRFRDQGHVRGEARTIDAAWHNLLSPNCASWKYCEFSVPRVGGRPWLRDSKDDDKWRKYKNVFDVTEDHFVVRRNKFGMYAKGLNMPCRIAHPLCHTTSKVMVEGKVRIFCSRRYAIAYPRIEICACVLQGSMAIFDIDPAYIPAEVKIWTTRQWERLEWDAFYDEFALLRDASCMYNTFQMIPGAQRVCYPICCNLEFNVPHMLLNMSCKHDANAVHTCEIFGFLGTQLRT
jgi:hypothetical protein